MIGAEFLFLDDFGPPSRAKRWTRALLVLGICGIFVGIGYVEYGKALKLASWTRVPCRITGSEVASLGEGRYRRDPYRARVTFEYQVGEARLARAYESNITQDVSEAYAVRDAYRKGLATACFVNPAVPGEAALLRPSVTESAAFFAGALFVTAAVFWFYCLPQFRGTAKPTGSKSVLSRRRIGIFAFAIACLFGGLLIAEYVLPFVRHLQSQTWPAVPCAVVESNVMCHEVGGEIHLFLYRTDVHYCYRVNGVEYHSNRYSFTEGGSLLASTRQRTARMFPRGLKVQCYVNPADPRDALLARHLSPGIVNAAYPMTPALVVIGVVLGIRGRMNRTHPARSWGYRCALLAFVGTLLTALVWAQIAAP